MSDLIRREDVIPFLDKYCSMELYPSEWDEVYEAIRMIPAVDAEPVRHGRWIDRDGKTWCSECEKSNKAYKPPFCPHCGARMDAKDTNVPTNENGGESDV